MFITCVLAHPEQLKLHLVPNSTWKRLSETKFKLRNGPTSKIGIEKNKLKEFSNLLN